MAAVAKTGKALGNIRVIDFTHRVAGPYCTKLLAGFGADVIKIEPPISGDPERAAPPMPGNATVAGDSISFLWLNTGKKSVALDLKTTAGRDAALALIQGADVVIENFSPGVMHRLGLDYDTLKVVNPGLVMVSISNFGQTGPYRDYKAEEIQLNAISGIMDSTGSPKREPLSSGPRLNQYTAGLHAYLATVIALEQRQSTPALHGQYIDLSIMESSMEQIENRVHAYLSNGTVAKRGPHPFVPWGNFSSKDGYVTIIGAPFRHWPNGVKIFGDEWLARQELFHVRDRIENRELINQHVQAWAKSKNKLEVFATGQAHGMSFGFVAGLDEAFNSSQHSARQFFTGIDHPATGKQLYCDAPFKMGLTPWSAGRAPTLGEHDAMLAAAQGSPAGNSSGSTAVNKGAAGHAAGQPLAGIRVIDMTHSWAGPHCTRLLADYGAEVIKVEYPRRMCFFRGARTQDHAYDKQTPWQQINRNKKSVALDLNVPAEREMLQDLVRVADVFVSNSRHGVLEKLGFDYATLSTLKPDIIMLSMTAFGDTGPYADYCAYGAVMEGVGGIQSLTRYEDDVTPQRIREMDVINGIGGAAAVVTALHYRRATGSGQYIDLSQMELPTHALIGEQLLQQAIDGNHASPAGNASVHFAPQGCYPCAGTDKWITLAVRTQEEWLAFCRILEGSPVAASGEEPALASLHSDSRFATGEGRLENRIALDALIARWTRDKGHLDLMRQLQAAGVPAAAVLDTSELAADPHLRARGYFHATEAGEDSGADSPKQRMGVPFKLQNTQTVARRGPNLGEHNLEVGSVVLNREHDRITMLDESSIGTAYDYP